MLNVLLNCSCNSEDIYDKLITTQQVEFGALITIFIAVVGIIGYATYLYNRKVAGEEIKTKVDEIFNKEKKNFLTEVKSEFQNELSFQKGENARLFAGINFDKLKESEKGSNIYITYLAESTGWINTALVNYISCGKDYLIRRSINFLIVILNRVVDEKLEREYYISLMKLKKNYPNKFYEMIQKVNESLQPEKDKIIELLDKIKEAGTK